MINQRKEKIEVDGVSIPFKISLIEFLESDINPYIEDITESDYTKVTTKHTLRSKILVMTFIFDPNKYLYMILLGFWNEDESLSWKGWSIERERRRKRYHDWFLFKELGFPPYHYCWGDVSSNLEMKTGISTISIIIKRGNAD